jgi:hypothetical protein
VNREAGKEPEAGTVALRIRFRLLREKLKAGEGTSGALHRTDWCGGSAKCPFVFSNFHPYPEPIGAVIGWHHE